MPQPTPQEPRWQHSVRTFFNVLFHELPGLAALNLVFLLSCLPVLTLGPALSALGRVTDELTLSRCAHPVRTYWACFKSRLSATLPWGLLFLALLAVLSLAFLYYGVLFSQSLLFLPLGMLSLLGLLALSGVALHFFPALTRSDAPARTILEDAAKTALVRLPATLAAALLSLLLSAALVLTFPLSIPLLLCLGGSVPSLIGSLARTRPEDGEG